MRNEQIYQQIRTTVQNQLPGSRIILFGSRARGDFDAQSDYDLLIVTNERFSEREKISQLSKLNRALVHTTGRPFDLLLNSEEELRAKSDLPGHIIRTALREGRSLS